MAKSGRRKPQRRGMSKEELETMVGKYLKVFEAAEPGLKPQGHGMVHGRPLDKRRALELAAFLFIAAVEAFDNDLHDALEYFYIARGLAISQGEVPRDILLPEPTVLHVTKKPS